MRALHGGGSEVCVASTALGYRLAALGYRSTALGYRSTALGCRSTALGYRLAALGYRLAEASDSLFSFPTAEAVGSDIAGFEETLVAMQQPTILIVGIMNSDLYFFSHG